jgi:hypothetical protein
MFNVLNSFADMYYAYQCVVDDIWSEHGIALFAVIVHYIDQDWNMHARLGICNGLKDLEHTGEVIRKLTYDGLINTGIGNTRRTMTMSRCIFACARMTREATCYLRGTRLKVLVVFVIANKLVWVRHCHVQIFNLLSRNSRGYVPISIARTR